MEFNGIEVEEIRSIHTNLRGWKKTFRFGNETFTLRGETEEEILKELKKNIKVYIEDHGIGKERTSEAKTTRRSYSFKSTTPHSRRGRPRGTVEAMEQLKNFLGNTFKAAAAAAMATNIRMTQEAGGMLLSRIYNRMNPKFNVYSGNLGRAYLATVIQGRNIVKRLKLSNAPKGNDFYTATNGHRAVELFEENHPIGKIRKKKATSRGARISAKSNRVRYRYKKRYEIEKGYTGNSALHGLSKASYFGYGSPTGADNRIQSGIVVENLAPYAGAVQAAGYPVIPGGIGRSYMGKLHAKQEQLMATYTKRMLKGAGLIK